LSLPAGRLAGGAYHGSRCEAVPKPELSDPRPEASIRSA